jgi:3-hydroxybutyryl-CoA dehydrogenase
MGMGIAQVLAIHGANVTVLDKSHEIAVAAVTRGRREVEGYERRGLVAPGAAERVAASVSAEADFPRALQAADMIVEAVSEELSLKHEVLGRVAEHASREALITSNTSSIPIGRLAAGLPHPDRVMGVHWFNPAMFVPGVEIIPTAETDSGAITRVQELLRAAGKYPVVVGDSPGFVANRLQFALFREAALLVEEGVADPAQVDQLVRTTFGYRLPFFGPFQIADMAGLDVYAGAYTTLSEAFGDRFATPGSLQELVTGGRTGFKSDRGGYTRLTAEEQRDLIDRRDESYQALGHLMRDQRS